MAADLRHNLDGSAVEVFDQSNLEGAMYWLAVPT